MHTFSMGMTEEEIREMGVLMKAFHMSTFSDMVRFSFASLKNEQERLKIMAPEFTEPKKSWKGKLEPVVDYKKEYPNLVDLPGEQPLKDLEEVPYLNMPIFPSEAEYMPKVLDKLREGKMIEALKILRDSSGLGLKEAKEKLDGLRGL